MKKLSLYILTVFCGLGVTGQQQRFDVAIFTAPRNWKKETRSNLVIYSRIDGGSWAQIIIYKCNASTGNIHADSDAEWRSLVLEQHTITGKEEKGHPQTAGEWTIISRSGVWQHEGVNVATILTTYSNNQVCFSTLLNATAQPYMNDYKKLLESLSINKTALKQYRSSSATPETADTQSILENTPSTAAQSSYTLPSTNFDDGWTSSVRADWVEVRKPGIRILIHYPNQQTDEHQFEKLNGDQNAWDVLVAPRYSNIENLQERGIQDYQSVTFLTADATERQTGKRVHIVLYKKHYDKGNGRYLEVVADSKTTFEREFGNSYITRSSWDYLEQTKSWDKLAAMQWRNKFRVTTDDLNGKWTSNSYASLRYYYITGGGFAGATATSMADSFTFLDGNKYESEHSGASGIVGNQKFSRQAYKGNVSVTNWNITLTGRFDGAAETYDCYFEAIKGGKILHLTDRNNTSLSLVKSNG